MFDFITMCDCSNYENVFLALYNLGYPNDVCGMIADFAQNITHVLGLCSGAFEYVYNLPIF